MSDRTRRWVNLIFGTIFLLALPLAVASYLYVSAQTEYFTQRKFRLLALQGEQLKSTIENYTQRRLPNLFDTLQEKTPPGAPPLKARELSLPTIFEQFDLGDLKLIAPYSIEPGEDRKATLQATLPAVKVEGKQEGEAFRLNFEYKDQLRKSEETLVFRATAQRQNLFEMGGDAGFAYVLVADAGGRVLFQKATPGQVSGPEETRRVVSERAPSELSIVNLATLLRERMEAEATGDKKERKKSPSLAPSIGQFSGLYTVDLAGTKYKLFLYPIQIFLYPPESKSRGALRGETNTLNWVVAGLIRSEDLLAESITIPHTVVMFFLFLFLLVILIAPFLKIVFLGPRDRLRTSDVLALASSVLVGSALISFFFFNLYTYFTTEDALDEQLTKLTTDVSRNFDRELTEICSLLKSLRAVAPPKTQEYGVDILTKEPFRSYFKRSFDTYFHTVSWVDASGQQVQKWVVKKKFSQLISVADRSYFKHLRDQRAWAKRVGGEDVKFWLEPLNSWSTGENQAVVATPWREGDGSLVLIGAKLISLREAVLPPGFGFVVVENNGNELFHSQPNHPRENLFEDCENNRALRAAVFGRAREFLDVPYLGRSHRFYVTPLQGVPWSLVVFRDKEYLRAANLEILSVALIFFVIYALVLLVPISLMLFWKSKAVWPDPGHASRYPQLFAAHGMVALVFVLVLLFSGTLQVWHTAIVLAPFALWITHLRLEDWQQAGSWRKVFRAIVLAYLLLVVVVWLVRHHKEDILVPLGVLAAMGGIAWFVFSRRVTAYFEKKNVQNHGRAYLWAASSLLVVSALLPSTAFYAISYRAEMERFVKYAQFQLLRSLLARSDRVHKEYRDIDKPEGFVPARLATTLDLYGCFFFGTTAFPYTCSKESFEEASGPNAVEWSRLWGSAAEKCAIEGNRFEKFLEQTRPLYNDTAALTHEFTHRGTGECALRWDHPAAGRLVLKGILPGGGEQTLLASDVPGWQWPSRLESVFLLFATVVVGLFLASFCPAFLARRVLLLDFEEAASRGRPDRTPIAIHSNLLLLGPPFSGKSKLLKDLELRDRIHILDLRRISEKWNWIQAAELEKIPQDKKVAVDHLDYDHEDPKTNRQKLQLLEKLLNDHRIVIAASAVDPLSFACVPAGDSSKEKEAAQLQDRWAGVLSVFTKKYVFGDDQPEGFLEALRKQAGTGGLSEQVVEQLTKECGPLPYLRRIGSELLEQQPSLADPGQVVSEVLDRAHAYYRALWAASSRDEKIAMLDIAQDGFLNSKNTGIRPLIQRGLVVLKPEIGLMNDSFRRFVLSTASTEHVSEWEVGEARGKWRILRWVLLAIVVGILLILFFAQRNVFDNIMLFLGAIGGGVAAFFKLLDLFRGAHSA